MSEQLNILFHTHRYPPTFMAGGELMVHRILRYLKEECGHNIKVITMNGETACYEGIDVLAYTEKTGDAARLEKEAWDWADIALAHLSSFPRAAYMRKKTGKPLVAVVHNPPQIQREKMNVGNSDMALFNAEWCKRDAIWGGKSIVITPPMVLDEWVENEEPGDCITLINLNANKGVECFTALAKAMPDRKFLGVLGSYGPQQTGPLMRLKNVEIHPHTTDIRGIYRRSRIVLMPSDLETWGMVAGEAIGSGVPVIVSPTDGLKENVSYAGLYANRNNPKEWMAHIKALDDPKAYKAQQKLCRQRFEELCSDRYLKELDAALKEVIRYKKQRQDPYRVTYVKGRSMTMVEMVALKTFISGSEGKILRGEKFSVLEHRAEEIAKKGNARFVGRVPAANPAEGEKKVVTAPEKAVAKVPETKGEKSKNPAAKNAAKATSAGVEVRKGK